MGTVTVYSCAHCVTRCVAPERAVRATVGVISICGRRTKLAKYTVTVPIYLGDYEGTIRQITIDELGHEEPTLLLTNQVRRSPVPLVERYARRMLIKNNIQDGVDFFHMDALSSAVAMKVSGVNSKN